MLKFNTLFPVKSDTSIGHLISIANTWILGSPHSQLSEEVIENNKELTEWEHNVGNEVQVAFVEKMKTFRRLGFDIQN